MPSSATSMFLAKVSDTTDSMRVPDVAVCTITPRKPLRASPFLSFDARHILFYHFSRKLFTTALMILRRQYLFSSGFRCRFIYWIYWPSSLCSGRHYRYSHMGFLDTPRRHNRDFINSTGLLQKIANKENARLLGSSSFLLNMLVDTGTRAMILAVCLTYSHEL